MTRLPSIVSFGVIVLAAGSSRRMGTPKQLLPFKGKSLLARAVETALASGATATVVVLGAGAPRMREDISPYPVDVSVNERHEEGMAGSLAKGLGRMMERHPGVDGVVIMVCDQPGVTGDHLESLVKEQRSSGTAIVSTGYGDTHGVPALFHRSLFAELLQLKGDRGARSLIEAHAGQAGRIAFAEAAVDIDTPEAYQALTGAGAGASDFESENEGA